MLRCFVQQNHLYLCFGIQSSGWYIQLLYGMLKLSFQMRLNRKYHSKKILLELAKYI